MPPRHRPINHQYDSTFHKLSVWVQNVSGLSIKDIALFVGGFLTVVAVLWLGVYSGKPRYREAARFGWCLLLLSFAIIGWGLYNHNLRDG